MDGLGHCSLGTEPTGSLAPGCPELSLHGAPGRPSKHHLHHRLWRPRLEHTELPSETPWMGEVAAPPGALLSSRHAPGMKRGEEDSHTPSTRHSRLPTASEFRMITMQSLQPMSECWASPQPAGIETSGSTALLPMGGTVFASKAQTSAAISQGSFCTTNREGSPLYTETPWRKCLLTVGWAHRGLPAFPQTLDREESHMQTDSSATQAT